MENRNSKVAWLISAVVAFCLLLTAYCLLPTPSVHADAYSSQRILPLGAIIDNPTIAIAGATATTGATPTSGAHRADIQWNFGTVTGSYGTCTVQAKTSYDGTNFLTLGSAVSVTATSNTLNAWSVIEQLGTNSVTSATASSTAALGFGETTKYTFACSSYGTGAPVTISVVYK